MIALRVSNADRQTVLGERIGLADTWWRRLRGLLGRAAVADGEGLLLRPCRSVHMVGMRFSLDVLFLDREDRVVAAYPALRPWAATSWHREARTALEVPTGTLQSSRTAVGDQLVIEQCEPMVELRGASRERPLSTKG